LGEPDDDNPGLDEADQEALIHVAAKKALEKGCGKGAGGRRVWAEEVLDPPVNPAAKLLNLVRRYCDVTVGMGERSYRRPSRRNGNPRMVLPSNVAPLPRITVIVDTSGSMDQQDLGLALGMIRKVLNSFHIRDGINVVTGDAKGQSKQICMADPKRIELTGGGGTNMAAVIAEALEARPKPQMIILCTDGWTPWPTEDPGIPVIACITRRVSTLPQMHQPPDWIVTIELTRSPI
jgi:predicted metal-dependent peptidase